MYYNSNRTVKANLHPSNGWLWRSLIAIIVVAVFCIILFAYQQQIIVKLNFYTYFGIEEKMIHLPDGGALEGENLTALAALKPENPNKHHIILMWTPIFGQYSDYPESLAGCPELNCKITSDKSEANKATAFVYHMRDFAPYMVLPKWSTAQFHVFFLQESPMHTYVDLKKRPNYRKAPNKCPASFWNTMEENRLHLASDYNDKADYIFDSFSDKLHAA